GTGLLQRAHRGPDIARAVVEHHDGPYPLSAQALIASSLRASLVPGSMLTRGHLLIASSLRASLVPRSMLTRGHPLTRAHPLEHTLGGRHALLARVRFDRGPQRARHRLVLGLGDV